METYLIVLAALFPIVNPPGAALVFFSLTKRISAADRRYLAQRVAINSFFVMMASFVIGAFILRVYGISLPVLRVAGGFIVAMSGWKLLNEGSDKEAEEENFVADKAQFASQAFYPLTLPLTTGPGTIAVLVSLGLSRLTYTDEYELRFFLAGVFAIVTMAAAIYACFAFSDRVQKVLGRAGTDIAVRLSAFILFCLGVQIIWTGVSALIKTL